MVDESIDQTIPSSAEFEYEDGQLITQSSKYECANYQGRVIQLTNAERVRSK